MSVVCVGLTTLDLVYRVDEVPGPNGKTQAVGGFRALGGPATNAALTAGRLGSSVALISRFPPPQAVAFFGGSALGERVRVVDIGSGTERFAVSSIVVDQRGRRQVVSENAVGWGPPGEVPAVVGDVMLADGHDPAAMTAALRGSGATVRVLDAGSWKPWMAGSSNGTVGEFTHVVASSDFAVPGGAAPLPWLIDQGVEFAAVTTGAGPTSWLAAAGESGELPPVEAPDAVIDTLGAGDVLHGAFAHFLELSLGGSTGHRAPQPPSTDDRGAQAPSARPTPPLAGAVAALASAMRVATYSVCRFGVPAGVEFYLAEGVTAVH